MLDVEDAYRRYSAEVLRFLRLRLDSREDAEDVCAMVFLEAWQRRAAYVERGDLRGWLYCLARSRAADHRRYHRRLCRRPAGPLPADVTVDSHDEHVVNRLWCRELIRAAALPERQKQALWYLYAKGYTPTQAAHVAGVSAGIMKALRSRALEKVRAAL